MTSLSTGYADALGRGYETATAVPGLPAVETATVIVIDPEGDHDGVYRAAVARSQATDVRLFASPQAFLQKPDIEHRGCMIVRFADAGTGVKLLQHEMKRREIELPLIVTTDGTTFTTATALMETGAFTVVQHPPSVDALRQYIDAAIQENRAAGELLRRYQEITAILRRLTPRQRRILELADQGSPNKRIATELDVSIRTVEVDRSKIMKAFDARSLASVTRKIGELRILSLWNSHWRHSRPTFQIGRHQSESPSPPDVARFPRHPK